MIRRSARRVRRVRGVLRLAALAGLLLVGGLAGSLSGVLPSATPPVAAQDRQNFAVRVAGSVDTTNLETSGLFTIRLEFMPEEVPDRLFALALALRAGGRDLLNWTHAPAPPTTKWKVGEKVVCEITSPFPAEILGTDIGEVEVLLGFQDPTNGTIYPPTSGRFARPGFCIVAHMTPPVFSAIEEEAKVVEILTSADNLAKAGRKPDAWSALEFGYRLATSDAAKLRFRDGMVRLGEFAPKPLTAVEEAVVKERIDDERERYLRQVSGRFWDQGKLHAALRILESIGGKLKEQADAAVLGALNSAQRAEKDVADLREKILERITDAEKEEAEAILRTLGRTKASLDKALDLAKAQKFAQARHIVKELVSESPKDVRDAARDALKPLEKAWLAATPPAEKLLADAELNHPAFARTAVSLSHEFIFIGPKNLVDTIPPLSRRDFDIAYVILTDLFGRRPNPSGDRVTVYFKELWDFGGGVGGGKIIDIGNANPDAKGTRVDTGLLFHELTHCIDDTVPIHAGFREGLADFGTACAHEMLGRGADAQAVFASSSNAFRKDYVERDLEYWRIPNYGPSAGFFLYFVEKYGRATASGIAHDWKGYRKFFREYRLAPVKDGREHCVARAMGHYLMRAFGPGVLDDLIAFRFPLVPDDKLAIGREVELFQDGDDAVVNGESDLQVFPNTQLRRDLAQRRAVELDRQGGQEDEVRRICREELGVLYDWHVIGPFEPQGTDPGAQIFPPERAIDFAAEFPQRMNTARWRLIDIANPARPVQINPLGWVLIEYSYMDNTATYGLTHVTVPEDVEAFLWVRADDDVAVFAAGERLDGFLNRGTNSSTQQWWRGATPRAPDAIRFPLVLKKGRTPILVKVKNHGGPAGFSAAVAKRDGRPIPGLATDAGPADTTKAGAAPKWKEGVKVDFKTKAALSKLDLVVGGLDVSNKVGAGTGNAKQVQWRKYTVRPGFPKDSPSNLFWLKSNLTDGMTDFRLTVKLAATKDAAPKLAVTFQGEGNADGLSGWNLLLWNAGGKLGGQIERYEDLWYQWPAAECGQKPDGKPSKKDDKDKKDDKPEDPDELVLTLVSNHLTVTMNGVALVTGAPVRQIPGRTRIGFSTWGGEPKFESIELERTK